MKRSRPGDGVTLSEVAAIVSDLERKRCTPAQVRSILVVNTRGRVSSIIRDGNVIDLRRRRGETRLYSAVDVALVRLALRLRACGVSPAVTRALLAQWRDELANVWRDDDPHVFVVAGFQAAVLVEGQPRSPHAIAWVPLRDVWSGVEARITQTRKREPEVWQFGKLVRAEALAS